MSDRAKQTVAIAAASSSCSLAFANSRMPFDIDETRCLHREHHFRDERRMQRISNLFIDEADGESKRRHLPQQSASAMLEFEWSALISWDSRIDAHYSRYNGSRVRFAPYFSASHLSESSRTRSTGSLVKLETSFFSGNRDRINRRIWIEDNRRITEGNDRTADQYAGIDKYTRKCTLAVIMCTRTGDNHDSRE